MVAERLEAVRKALDLSKIEFADLIRINQSSYSKISKGEKPILPRHAMRLWHEHGIDLNFVYLGHTHSLPSHLSSAVKSHLNGD